MLAVVCHGKEDLRIEEVPERPVAQDEVRVAVAFGGICGSDIHYFRRGAVGDFAIREPMTLGHEISGTVVEVGGAVRGISPGMNAALNPSRPCRNCSFCIDGRSNLCENMQFLGSAARFPHVQGGFSQHLVLRMDQVIPVPEDTDLLKLSCAEPLSVGLHAVQRAGSLVGKRVIVTGSGPIGLLTAASALYGGAREVIATDIVEAPLTVARERIGVHGAINVATDTESFARFESQGGYFDVAFEVSGSPVALSSLLRIVRKGGKIVQVGMLPSGNTPIPVNVLQSREIELIGAFRAHNEFGLAVELITRGGIDVAPILSGTFAIADAVAAFQRADDRNSVVKLHLDLG